MEMRFIGLDCIKKDCLYFPMAEKAEMPCITCCNYSEYHPTGTGRILERTPDDDAAAAAGEAELAAPATHTETCREATSRWKEALKEAKASGDKPRQKAIHSVLNDFLGNLSGTKMVELPDPFTAPIEQLSQSHSRGVTL